MLGNGRICLLSLLQNIIFDTHLGKELTARHVPLPYIFSIQVALNFFFLIYLLDMRSFFRKNGKKIFFYSSWKWTKYD